MFRICQLLSKTQYLFFVVGHGKSSLNNIDFEPTQPVYLIGRIDAVIKVKEGKLTLRKVITEIMTLR